MSDAFGFPPQALLKDIFLRHVQRLEVLGVHDVLWAIFHKFDTGASANWNEIFLSDLLLEIVLADYAEESTLNFFQRLRVDAHIIVMEIELFFFCTKASFHRWILFIRGEACRAFHFLLILSFLLT